MKSVMILGATGSIGASALSVIRDNPDDFEVVGIAARRAGPELVTLADEFPRAAVASAEGSPAFNRAVRALHPDKVCFTGPDAAERLVRETAADVCVAGISGTAGLAPAFAAAETGKHILLANKEVLVSAGRLFLDAVLAGGASVSPIDSEHAALAQCLEGRTRNEVEKLVVTASGGPFRTWPAERIAAATPEDALRHPVWSMGAKISVDSATLANKALEVIEAHMLFGFPADAIEVVVHPQSIVHGMVVFVDGSMLAHMGACDMRQPIAFMLFHPERRAMRLPRVDLATMGRLDFEKPDGERFPMLPLGLEALRRGGGHPAVYNAANETAVELFLAGRLGFGGIAPAVERALEREGGEEFSDLAGVMDAHDRARRAVLGFAEGGATS